MTQNTTHKTIINQEQYKEIFETKESIIADDKITLLH